MDATSARLTASVWKYFAQVEHDSTKYSKCLLCGFELKGPRAGNAKKHLLSARHPEPPQDVWMSVMNDSAPKKHLKDEIQELFEKVR